MHRDVVTHVAVSSADFFITGSVDGEQGQRLCIIRVFFRLNHLRWFELLYFDLNL